MAGERLEIPPSIRTFGTALRWARERRGLTLREVARRLELSAPFVSDLEHDRRETVRAADFERILGVEGLEELLSRPRELCDWLSRHPELVKQIREVRNGTRKVIRWTNAR